MKKTSICSLLAIAFLLTGCESEKPEEVIYTSFYPIYYFTKRIVGDKYEVKNLTPAGSEPHDYEPKAREVIGMSESKAVFVSGLSLEPWTSDMPDMLKDKVHVISDSVETLRIDNVVDPHVWLSIPNAITEMENILSVMKDIDAANQEYYQMNFEEAKKDFLKLDTEYRTDLSGVKNPYIVVSHAAFGYLCHEYGLTQIYVSGLSPEQEPTPKGMQSIMEKVKEYHVNTIFYEELVSSAISETIASETGATVETLNPLEGLTKEESETEDYLSVMRENLVKIRKAVS